VATSELQDGVATITVLPPPIMSVAVSPPVSTVALGTTTQLMVTLRDAQGNVLTGREVTWSTSASTVATVSSSGLVTGVTAGGPVTITAASEGQSGTALVTVVRPPVATVEVTPGTTTVAVGSTVQLVATPRDQNGLALTDRAVSWISANPAIASVSNAGVVTGVSGGGPVTMTATSDGVSGSANVTVTQDPCQASSPITVGSTQSGILAGTDCSLADGSFVDYYRLTVVVTGRIQIDVSSTAFDAFLLLFEEQPDGSVTPVDFDNDAGPANDARLLRDVSAGETFLIGANSLLAAQTGVYQVSVSVAAPTAGRVVSRQPGWRPGDWLLVQRKVGTTRR
jgi:hypothetical protein